MNINGKVALRAAIAAVLMSAPSHSALSSDTSASLAADTHVSGVLSRADISAIRRAAKGSLLAIGRVDAVSLDRSEVSLLGNRFAVLGTPRAQSAIAAMGIGDSVALFGDSTEHGYFVSAAMILPKQYVPGASHVYLRGPVAGSSSASDRYSIGSQNVVFGDLTSAIEFEPARNSEIVEIVGTQPSIGGVVLATWQQRPSSRGNSALVGTSVSTGRVDASVGTGVDASVGTGRVDASVGTGRIDASVGTGRVDASVGTGVDASVGTGRVDASVGTGVDASVGTGRVDASVGTGVDASVGTGRVDASVGTGVDASVGTGRVDASVGTGVDASVGTGRIDASVGTGVDASVGTGGSTPQ